MVNIQPISVWKDGAEKTASVLHAVIINDDMSTNAQFYYQLKSADTEDQSGEFLVGGNIGMSGEDYQSWDDSNASAYNYIADKLNLTIVD
jgi:hypothetical protein